MGENDPRHTHAIFVRAMDMAESERDQFLARECAGDDGLRKRVERLLSALPRSTSFLETGPLSRAREVGEPAEVPALSLPGYRLVRVLGAGGMATVYEAQQTNPPRTVALKIMNRSLASTSAIHRFRFETEVLARLHHPGIAQIYESGTSHDALGRHLPFFAMELVEGAQAITAYATSRSMPLPDRLRLFAEVCDAVHHGHQQGVIHRDLKPANILVDAAGRPKVIDFGIARPSDADKADITRQTDSQHLIGTLNGMSPEQCLGKAIDVRSDVYSLGVVLYQLIAERTPHDLRSVPIPEAVRIIVEDPPRPLDDAAPEVKGELEAIVRMAMEKEPTRRYASAAALAADVRRLLQHEPIEARPPTTLYHLRKFARRHRGLVVSLAATLIVLVAGIASTLRMAFVAERARLASEARERELEEVTAFQESMLSGIDVKAMGERLHDELMQGVRHANPAELSSPASQAELERLLGNVNFTTLALRMLDDNVLQRSREAIKTQFAAQPLVRARLLHTLAGTMATLGLPDAAISPLEEAAELRTTLLGENHDDTLVTLQGLGTTYLQAGRLAEAERVLRLVLERRTRTSGENDRYTLRVAVTLGGVLRHQGKLDEAEELWTKTHERQRALFGEDDPDSLRSLNNVALMHALRGRNDRAEASWRELFDRRRRVHGPDHPLVYESLGNLGLILLDEGKHEEARDVLEEHLAFSRRLLGDDHARTLISMANLASLRLEMGDAKLAEPLARECLERRERTLKARNPATLRARVSLGYVLKELGRMDEAESLTRGALEQLRQNPGEDHPDTLEAIHALGMLLRDKGSLAEADALGAEVVSRARRASGENDPLLGEFLSEHGRTLTRLGRTNEAETELLAGFEALKRTRGESHPKTRAAAGAMAEYFEARDLAEPGRGHGATAQSWRKKAATK